MDRKARTYNCVASSVEGFVQQVAVSYLTHGYFFFVSGFVPEGKPPELVDEKLVAKYGIDVSKWSRARRKQAGSASLQYIRHGRVFLILATHGKHQFFTDEKASLRDARRTPIRVFGYSLSVRGGHPHVRIDRPEHARLKAHLTGLALHRSKAYLERQLAALPYSQFAPVRGQILGLWRMVNRLRAQQGLEAVPFECLELKRKIVRPFRT